MLIAQAMLWRRCGNMSHKIFINTYIARKNAAKNNARIATMPGINEQVFFHGPIDIDYERCKETAIKYASLLSKTTKAYVINHGKTVTLDLSGRIGKADTGIYGKSGEYGNLPAGEAYIAPLEGKASGGIVIDGVMAGIGGFNRTSIYKSRKRNGH